MKRIVFYHSSCRDGMCSAAVCYLEYGDTALYIPVNYGDSLADLMVKHQTADIEDVLFVDFMFRDSTDTIIQLLNQGIRVTIIDHHLSSVGDVQTVVDATDEGSGLTVQFDNGHSGAYLTWKFFYPNAMAPAVVRYVEDRDIWLWKMPRTKAINAALQGTPLNMDVWVELLLGWDQAKMIDRGLFQTEFMAQQIGAHMARARQVEVADARGAWFPAMIFGYSMKEVASEVCHFLLEQYPGVELAIGVPTNMKEDGQTYSVRSKNGQARAFCETYGGGGHDNAAGFKLDNDTLDWADTQTPNEGPFTPHLELTDLPVQELT